MRIFNYTLLCICIGCTSAYSQNIVSARNFPAEKLGRFIVSPAAGMGAFLFYYPFHNYTPSFNFSVERVVHESGYNDFGIGFGGGYRSMRIERKTDDGTIKDAYRITYAYGVRASMYPKAWGGRNYDVYLAGTAGFSYNQFNGDEHLLKNNNFTPGTGFYGAAVLGTHYYFTKFFGIYGEAGFDLDWVKGGLTFKL